MSGAGAPPSVAVWMTSPHVCSSELLFDRGGDGGMVVAMEVVVMVTVVAVVVVVVVMVLVMVALVVVVLKPEHVPLWLSGWNRLLLVYTGFSLTVVVPGGGGVRDRSTCG